jgi:hypothetical protein
VYVREGKGAIGCHTRAHARPLYHAHHGSQHAFARGLILYGAAHCDRGLYWGLGAPDAVARLTAARRLSIRAPGYEAGAGKTACNPSAAYYGYLGISKPANESSLVVQIFT